MKKTAKSKAAPVRREVLHDSVAELTAAMSRGGWVIEGPAGATVRRPRPVNKRSLQSVVGPEVYRTWVDMLRRVVPGSRTHRLAPMIAGMLKYACAKAADQAESEPAAGTVAASLLELDDVYDTGEVQDRVHDVVVRLFRDAGVPYERTNAKGKGYSIAENVYEEFLHWYDMPWE